jgi:hypothetical protein
MDDVYPAELYKAIGSMKDDPLELPEDLPFSLDAPRLSLDGILDKGTDEN